MFICELKFAQATNLCTQWEQLFATNIITTHTHYSIHALRIVWLLSSKMQQNSQPFFGDELYTKTNAVLADSTVLQVLLYLLCLVIIIIMLLVFLDQNGAKTWFRLPLCIYYFTVALSFFFYSFPVYLVFTTLTTLPVALFLRSQFSWAVAYFVQPYHWAGCNMKHCTMLIQCLSSYHLHFSAW